MKVLRGELLLIALACAFYPNEAAARTEPNSFLNRPAHDKNALMRQLRNDKVVMDRFMRHFHMSKEEVLSFASTLRLAKLERSGAYQVYNAKPNGRIDVRTLHFKKGTYVWVDQHGRPVMKKSCANPLMRQPSEAPPPTEVIIVERPPELEQFPPEQPEPSWEPLVLVPMEELIAPPALAEPEVFVPEIEQPPIAIFAPPLFPPGVPAPIGPGMPWWPFLPFFWLLRPPGPGPGPVPVPPPIDAPPLVPPPLPFPPPPERADVASPWIPGPAAAVGYGMLLVSRLRRRKKAQARTAAESRPQ
jgi:hypothetical protein